MRRDKISFFTALLPIIILLLTGAFSVFYWKVGMIVPLLSGVVTTGIIGFVHNFKWEELQEGLKDGVANALPAIFYSFNCRFYHWNLDFKWNYPSNDLLWA